MQIRTLNISILTKKMIPLGYGVGWIFVESMGWCPVTTGSYKLKIESPPLTCCQPRG